MVASGVVYEALLSLFDAADEAVMAVSGYDHAVLYANPACGPALQGLSADHRVPSLPVDLIGRTIDEVFELYGVDPSASAFLRCLESGDCEAVEHAEEWRVVSPLRLSDESRTAFGSMHRVSSEAEAKAWHNEMLQQATVAIEFAETERLIHVGMEALHRARQRATFARDTALAALAQQSRSRATR